MTVQILSIAGESPHKVTNGYTLRVHNLLTHAARLPNTEVHCFSPVTEKTYESARDWANSKSIHFHGIVLKDEMQYDRSLRQKFAFECGKCLAAYVNRNSIILLHGLVPIVDFAYCDFAEHSIADLIDEIGPLVKRDVLVHFANGRFKRCLRAIKTCWSYRRESVDILRRYKHVAVVAHDDAQRLRKSLPKKAITVIPNGVELPEGIGWKYSAGNPRLLFHGAYSYQPNEEAALFLIRDVAPLLGKSNPHCRIILAGRNPTQKMFDEQSMAGNVKLAGEVDNMSDYLATASIGVYPIFTRAGLQNKILEAWSHGLPIVTTPEIISVFNAFSRDAEYCARTALSAKGFADQIGKLLKDSFLCEQLSMRSRQFVKENFEWQGAVQQFIRLQ